MNEKLKLAFSGIGKCVTPDYEGGFDIRKHVFDKDGWCIFCGYHKLENNPKAFKKFLAKIKK